MSHALGNVGIWTLLVSLIKTIVRFNAMLAVTKNTLYVYVLSADLRTMISQFLTLHFYVLVMAASLKQV